MEISLSIFSAREMRALSGFLMQLADLRDIEVNPCPPVVQPGEPVHDVADPAPEQPVEAPKRRGRPPKAASVVAAPAPAEPPSPPPEIKVEDAKKALAALVERSSLTTGMEALSRFGATRISELKPEQWAEFIDFCRVMPLPEAA